MRSTMKAAENRNFGAVERPHVTIFFDPSGRTHGKLFSALERWLHGRKSARRKVTMRTPLALLAGVICTVGSVYGAPAHAAPCSSLGTLPLVFIENGDTQEGLLKRLGARLVNSSTPVRLVYKNLPTCTLAADIYNDNPLVTDLTGARPIRYIPSATEDPGWNPSLPAPTCEADVSGNAIDLGIGATYLSSCPSLPPKPARLSVENGPVQAYGFIVPQGSSQIAITAEEGYLAYGFPAGDGQAAPWLEQGLRLSRAATASTALTCSAAIGLKASQLRGTIPTNNTSTEVLNLVANSFNPNATIGILGTEVYDSSRNIVKLLAFRGFGQRYAYFPDSSATSFDKQNLRDGHYLPWAPTAYITRVDGTGKAQNPNARRILDLVSGSRIDPDVNGLDQVIASGLVPECAMKVARKFDGGDLELLSAPDPCVCTFEARVPQGSTTCKKCTDDVICGGGKCRRGYCGAT